MELQTTKGMERRTSREILTAVQLDLLEDVTERKPKLYTPYLKVCQIQGPSFQSF
jgi:hypothetical protein